MRISAGMALMKPTSFLFEDTLTPQCHCDNQPGGRRALRGDRGQLVDYRINAFGDQLSEECRRIFILIYIYSCGRINRNTTRTDSLPLEKVW